MRQHASTYSVLTHTLHSLGGVNGQNIFPESSQVAYQIKLEWSIEHHASTYSVLTHTLDPWGWVKGQNIFFLKVVLLHIELEGMENRAPCKHIFCAYTHPLPVGWIKTLKSEYGHVAYQIKGKEVKINVEATL